MNLDAILGTAEIILITEIRLRSTHVHGIAGFSFQNETDFSRLNRVTTYAENADGRRQCWIQVYSSGGAGGNSPWVNQ